MLGKTHLSFSIASALGAAALGLVPTAALPLTVASAALGSLLPDLDEPESMLGRRLVFLSWPIKAVFGHRTITHSIWACAGIFALPHLFLQGHVADVIAMGLGIGYASHLVGDALTPQGVPLLWPIRSKVTLGLFRTGGIGEAIAFGIIAAAGAFSALQIANS